MTAQNNAKTLIFTTEQDIKDFRVTEVLRNIFSQYSGDMGETQASIKKQALELGADAVVGFKQSSDAKKDGSVMFMASAVKLEPSL